MRGQAGDEHGGPAWFKEESSPAGWRELLRAWGDEGDGSLSHRGAVSFKTNFSPVLDGRVVEKRKKPVPEGPEHADDGFTASRCGLSGTGS